VVQPCSLEFQVAGGLSWPGVRSLNQVDMTPPGKQRNRDMRGNLVIGEDVSQLGNDVRMLLSLLG